MQTLTLNYTFPSDTEGWSWSDPDSPADATTAGWYSSFGSQGSLGVSQDGSAATTSCNGYWSLSGTWASFGVPGGSAVSTVQISVQEWISNNASGAGQAMAGPYTLAGSSSVTMLAGRGTRSDDSGWVSRSGSAVPVPSGSSSSGSTVTFQLGVSGGDDSHGAYGFQCNLAAVSIVITYGSVTTASGTGSAPGTSTASGAGKVRVYGAGTAPGEANDLGVVVPAGSAVFNVTAESFAQGLGKRRLYGVGSAPGSSDVYSYGPPYMLGRAPGEAFADGVGKVRVYGSATAPGDSSSTSTGTPLIPFGFAPGEAFADGVGKVRVYGAGSAAGEANDWAYGHANRSAPPSAGYAPGEAFAAANSKVKVYGVGSSVAESTSVAAITSAPVKRGQPCCCNPSPPTGNCSVRFTIYGCQVGYQTVLTGELLQPWQQPVSEGNPSIMATIHVTGAGFDLTQTTTAGDNTTFFELGGGTVATPAVYTWTVTAPGYKTQTGTFTLISCWLNGRLYSVPWIQVSLAPDTVTIVCNVGRCDYPGGAPIYDDGSGTTVSISGGTSGTTDVNGNVVLTWNVPDDYASNAGWQIIGTATGPDPYYLPQTWTIAQAFISNGVNLSGAGAFANSNGCVINTSVSLSLKPDYICCIAAQTESSCIEFNIGGQQTACVGSSPQVRPFPLTPTLTIMGINVPLSISYVTNQFGVTYPICTWTNPCVTIAGICWSVVLESQGWYTASPLYTPSPGTWVVALTAVVKGDPAKDFEAPLAPWKQAICYHQIAPLQYQQYSPCGNPNCHCRGGDFTEFGAWQMTVLIALCQDHPGGGGTNPLNSKGYAVTNYGIYQSGPWAGCPITEDATLTE